jgi:hypothetical protein
MKWYRVAHLSVLIMGFAISSPKAMAQLVPAADLPHVDTGAARSASVAVQPEPILAYTRPTEKEKLQLFEFDAFGPYAFAKATFAGGFQQATREPPEWGTGWDAFGVRVASSFGIQLVTTTARYGMAEILHEDAAYYRCECKGILPRVRHAVVSTLMGRHGEDGHYEFSYSGLVSPYAGTMSALAWYPGRFGVKDGFRMGNYNLAGQAVQNLAFEFIYGGPHTLFSHIRRSKSQGGTAVAQNP